MLGLQQVMVLTGLDRAALDDAVRRGEFPRPLPLGPWRTAWVATDVEAWLAGRRVAAHPYSAQERLARRLRPYQTHLVVGSIGVANFIPRLTKLTGGDFGAERDGKLTWWRRARDGRRWR